MATHAQSTSNFSLSAGTTLAQAFASPTTTGSLLVAWCAWQSTTLTCAVTDTQSNTWTPIAGSLSSSAGSGTRTQVFWALASAATAPTVTMTVSGSVAERDMVITEFAGTWGASPADLSNQASGSTANPSTTVTATAAGEVIYGGAWDSAGTISAGATYTLAAGPNGNGAEYKLSSASGSNTVPFVNASAGNWLISVATFAEGAAVSPAPRTFNAIPFIGGGL